MPEKHSSLQYRIELLEKIAQRPCPLPDGPPYCDDDGIPCLSCKAKEELDELSDLVESIFIMLRKNYNHLNPKEA